MSLYRRHNHAIPALNTASLPDLIFTILFFFMLVTHMRKASIKVKYQVPVGTELTNLTKKSTVSYIYIGKPLGETGQVLSSETKIQLNDKLVSLNDIKQSLVRERNSMSPEERKAMLVSIRADQNTNMGLIIDLKQIFREANVLNVNYAAVTKPKR